MNTTQMNDDMHDDNMRDAINTLRMKMYAARVTLNIADIGAMVLECYSVLSHKGYPAGYGDQLSVDFKSDQHLDLRVRVYDRDMNTVLFMRKPDWNDAESVRQALTDIVHDVIMQPTKDELARSQWRQKLADMINDGEQLEVGIEYVQMLKATAERLATNALEGPRERYDMY